MCCLHTFILDFIFNSRSQWDFRDGDGDSQCDRHNEIEVYIYFLRKLQKKRLGVKSSGVGRGRRRGGEGLSSWG